MLWGETLPSLHGWEPAKILCSSKDRWGWGGDEAEGTLRHTSVLPTPDLGLPLAQQPGPTPYKC